MGRKAKTDDEKRANGTFKPSRSEKARAVVKPPIVGVVAPEDLTDEAKQVWEAVQSTLTPGYLQPESMPLFERWCRNYVMYRKLARDVEVEGVTVYQETAAGTVVVRRNPSFDCLMQVEAALLSIERQLGFTPFTRTKTTSEEPKEEESNPFSALEHTQ